MQNLNEKADGLNEKNMDKLRNDNVYVSSRIVPLSEIAGMPVDRKFNQAIISEGKIVNIVSPDYGFMPNEQFFYEVESKLIDADIKYATRSINRDNKSFAVDYILQDESYHVNVKNSKDEIKPMLRFVNNYAPGVCSGSFGFFRKVCQNGLHIAQTNMGFKVRHKKDVSEIAMPGIASLIKKFMDNEFYSLHKKFEVLAETPIIDINQFVKITAEKLDLFKFGASEKNPNEPSKNAQIVIDTINREAKILGSEPTLWLGYNAFNEQLHSGKKPFQRQRVIDTKLFNTVSELVN